MTNTKIYAGSFVYNNNALEYALFDEGRLLASGGVFEYQYFLKVVAKRKSRFFGNHLGNTRVTFSGNTGLIQQQDHYYPFGMNFSGIANAQAANIANKYKYNGKELQADLDLNWYDYGARFYDPQIGRWHSVDPLAEKYFGMSPYNYVLNNPLNAIDPNGMDVFAIAGGFTFTGIDAQNFFRQLQSSFGNQQDTPKKKEDDNKDGESNKSSSIARQFLNGTPIIGSALSSGDKLEKGDYIGASADFLYALAEMFTLGIASEYKIAQNAVKTGTTVLGKYPDYINLASKVGAKRFNIPTNIWNRMTPSEQWAANTKFLDRVIARGDKIVLSNRVTDINKVTGAFRQELDYLISKGYKLSSDGLKMIK